MLYLQTDAHAAAHRHGQLFRKTAQAGKDFKVKVLDLFAGIGGFSLAAHWLGWQTVAFVEWAEYQQKVLAKNFPGVPIYGDIREFDGTKYAGSVDVISGGFPCQPFSSAGKRKGRDDDRFLFPEMLKVISEVKPRWVVAENVRGFLNIESGRIYEEIAAQLESEGYQIATLCIPASAINAPHRRDRIWIIAHLQGVGRGKEYKNRRRGGEGMESKRKYGLRHGSSTIGHTDSLRPQRTENGKGTDKGADQNHGWGDEEHGQFGERSFCEDEQNDRHEIRTSLTERHRVTFHASDTYGNGLQGWLQTNGNERSQSDDEQSFRCSRGWSEHWLETATRLCRVDDGLSSELDIIGSRDNRAKRLSALGNAIVPQIAYEIFKAIEAAETETNNGL